MGAQSPIATTLESIAQDLLSADLDPIPRYLLLRDVVRAEPSMLAKAHQQMLESAWVRDLQATQRDDGSWGMFHSENTKAPRQRYRTTEQAIRRCHVIGLQRDDLVLSEAIRYMADVLEGHQTIRDHPEKNDRWETGAEMFVAGTLAMVDPYHPSIDSVCQKWRYIAECTFASGQYSVEAEKQAHYEVHGITSKLRYLGLYNMYALHLISARPNVLPETTEHALLAWLLQLPKGLGYLADISLQHTPPNAPFRQVAPWLRSLELLMRFPLWPSYFSHITEWLWNQRNDDNRWDFGPRNSDSVEVPLSENWRGKSKRQIDYTVKALCLLRRSLQ
jgi:hypothetical protein